MKLREYSGYALIVGGTILAACLGAIAIPTHGTLASLRGVGASVAGFVFGMGGLVGMRLREPLVRLLLEQNKDRGERLDRAFEMVAEAQAAHKQTLAFFQELAETGQVKDLQGYVDAKTKGMH